MNLFSSWNTFKRVNQFSHFPFHRSSVISEIIKLTLRFVHFRIYSHKPAHLCYLFWYPFVPKCVCFPQNCRVQTVLQTSYESWRFWLHRVVTVRGKQRKTDQEREESICFHPKPSRGSLMPAILGKTAATHTDTQSKYTECSGGLLGSRVWSLTTTALKFLHSKRSCAKCVFFVCDGTQTFIILMSVPCKASILILEWWWWFLKGNCWPF